MLRARKTKIESLRASFHQTTERGLALQSQKKLQKELIPGVPESEPKRLCRYPQFLGAIIKQYASQSAQRMCGVVNWL